MDFEESSTTILYFGPLSGGILYVLARVVTLVLAFTSLRDLPPGAYDTVHWTTFIQDAQNRLAPRLKCDFISAPATFRF